MAFDFQLFKKFMRKINALGGFDKQLEINLLKDRIRIHYLKDAIVWDEKVSSTKTFTTQRMRWIAAQIRYGVGSIRNAFYSLLRHGKIDYFNKAFQFLLLPRLLLLGGLFICLSLSPLLRLDNISIYLASMLVTFIGSLFVALPLKFYNRLTLRSLIKLPQLFVLMVIASGGYKKAATNFLHTPHQSATKS